jgi:ketosteroid isomerase-like protein
VSSENVDIVKRCLAAYRQGGFEATRGFIHPTFEMIRSFDFPESGSYGAAEAVNTMRDWTSAFRDYSADPAEFIDAGDCVVVALEERGKARGSGIELRQVFYMLCTLREGKIAKLWWFRERQAALSAAGLAAGPAHGAGP